MTRSPLVAIAWCRFQARTRALAATFGGQAHFVYVRPDRPLTRLLPFRYLHDAIRTWSVLQRRQPRVVLVITPPVFAPLVAWLWCKAHGSLLLIDSHTGAFHSRKWQWALPLLRWVARRARAVLVHTEEDQVCVAAWGARAIFIPDDIPNSQQASPQPPATRPRVVVAGSFDADEPVDVAMQAAALLPDVEFRFTGQIDRLPPTLRARLPVNVRLLGYLSYPQFLGELQAAHVIAVFTTHPHAANRAAYEAVGLGRPLVCSDVPGLRSGFGDAALFSLNEAGAIARTLQQALADQSRLAGKSEQARQDLSARRQAAVAQLATMGVHA